MRPLTFHIKLAGLAVLAKLASGKRDRTIRLHFSDATWPQSDAANKTWPTRPTRPTTPLKANGDEKKLSRALANAAICRRCRGTNSRECSRARGDARVGSSVSGHCVQRVAPPGGAQRRGTLQRVLRWACRGRADADETQCQKRHRRPRKVKILVSNK